jgi:thiamine-phosphate pyrophosphorylase
MTHRALAQARLYAILDTAYADPALWPDLAARLIQGGAGVLQIRAKNAAPADIAAWARELHPLAQKAGVPLILNDHPDIAAETGVDGCHLGQDDLPLSEARRVLGPQKILGKSTHSLAQIRAAIAEKPDYIGFGPLIATPTKPDYAPIGLGEIRMAHGLAPFPVFCIGGIKKDNLAPIVQAGARRVAVVSGLLQAGDPAQYARDVLAQLPELPPSETA